MAKFQELPPSLQRELRETAEAIVREGHGLLAADESTSTVAKRFYKAGKWLSDLLDHLSVPPAFCPTHHATS